MLLKPLTCWRDWILTQSTGKEREGRVLESFSKSLLVTSQGWTRQITVLLSINSVILLYICINYSRAPTVPFAHYLDLCRHATLLSVRRIVLRDFGRARTREETRSSLVCAPKNSHAYVFNISVWNRLLVLRATFIFEKNNNFWKIFVDASAWIAWSRGDLVVRFKLSVKGVATPLRSRLYLVFKTWFNGLSYCFISGKH